MVNDSFDSEDSFEGALGLSSGVSAERIGIAALTPRQKDCLRLTAQFKGSKEIGHELGVSQKTVDTHIAAAIKTLGASNRRHAARLFSQEQDEGASDKLLRQTPRLGDLPTNQSPFPPQSGDAELRPRAFQEKGHGLTPTPPWKSSDLRFRDVLEGVKPDDIKPINRVILIVIGAILIVLALAITITFVEVLSRLTDKTA
jgi:DNA-binding CsgD family transcriptional regulator